MKNVAGYDVLASDGGLARHARADTEVSLKVPPLPVCRGDALRLEIPQDKAIGCCQATGADSRCDQRLRLGEGELALRLSGRGERGQGGARGNRRRADEPDEAQGYWLAIREQTDPFFRTDKPLWRLSVPSVAAPLALPGEQLIEWGGALRWLASNADARHRTRSGGRGRRARHAVSRGR